MQTDTDMPKTKVILAYSGGLDTSCILKWLIDKNYVVICYIADVGQSEDFEAAREKALKIGAFKVVIENLKETFLEDYVWPAIQTGVIYESRYLLGTSIARPCISVGLIKCAKENGAYYIAHGATGKGNDQVRFELSCYYLLPEIKIIAPWRDEEFINRFQGRTDLINYAKEHNIPVSATTKSPWSMDANLMHISYESGVLEDPNAEPPADLYQMTNDPRKAPEEPCKIEIEFTKGLPTALVTMDNKRLTSHLDMYVYLNKVGGLHGIGRIDIVENRFIGLKSRGVYETPAGQILYVAHNDLEIFCMDKEVYRTKSYLRDRLSDYIYNGFWFSPEACYAKKCILLAEEQVNGKVKVQLYKGNVYVLGRSSSTTVYNQNLVSMDKHGDFSPQDATGFINIHAVRLKEYSRNFKKNDEYIHCEKSISF